jgi:hypothetical protein
VLRSRYIVLYGGLCLLLFALMAKASGNIADLDLWHEMALAREAWQTGRVPTHDSFAYTRFRGSFTMSGALAWWRSRSGIMAAQGR